MLVLTRKLDQQILIGDDIRLTLIKTRGNTVRIGIEAPREVRVVRGELVEAAPTARESDDTPWQPSEREQPFAHPPQSQPKRPKQDEAESVVAPRAGGAMATTSRAVAATQTSRNSSSDPRDRSRKDQTQLFVGSVGRRGQAVRLRRAPLAGRVPTT